MPRPDPADFPAVLDAAHAAAASWLGSLDTRPVFPTLPLPEIAELFGGDLPEDGEPSVDVVRRLAAAGDASAVASPGPNYFGYVIGGSLPAAVGADWLTGAWDQNGGLWSATPAAAACEETVARWIPELLGLPAGCGVGLVTGGQMANFTCLAAARQSLLRRAGWDVGELGLVGAPTVHLVAGEEGHVTIDGALRLLGFGTRAVHRVPADRQGRMDASALRSTLEPLDGPVLVCAQAGNVNTGAFDPFPEIVAATHAKGGWVHVDGAFGLWAAASGRRRHLVAGLAGADSWATDAHKWLNVPYDSGLAITAHPGDHLAAMSRRAAYLQSGSAREPLDWVPEFSRRARGFALWAALRSLGRRGLAEMIDRGCDLALRGADRLRAEPGVEILSEVVLNQVLVRFHGGGDPAEDDALTRDVVRRVQEERACWLSGTRWQGKDALRFSVSNWATREEHVDRATASIVRCFRDARRDRDPRP